MKSETKAKPPAKQASWQWAGVDSPWTLAEKALGRLGRIYLWGPPGVGKSFLAAKAAPNRFQLTLSDDHTVQELMGHYVPDGTVFRWHEGPVCQAFREGCPLVLNEIGRASAAVQDFLLGVLDSHDVARITLPSGAHLRPSPGFSVIATSNSPPDELEAALRSRFEAEIHVGRPHPDLCALLEAELPGLGEALDDSFNDPERALDPRRLLSFAGLRRANLPAREAACLAFGERAPDVIAALSARGLKL
ncbi:MAG: AAA family ATPase [Acidobacteria bacterium]|nr:AAA family ATPase [Acidobacteriota bacterium]